MERKTVVPDIEPIVRKNGVYQAKAVNQYGLDGKYIKTFPSQSEAGLAVGGNSRGINICTKGKSKTYKGYQWRSAE